jgi:hypothetical protein
MDSSWVGLVLAAAGCHGWLTAPLLVLPAAGTTRPTASKECNTRGPAQRNQYISGLMHTCALPLAQCCLVVM